MKPFGGYNYLGALLVLPGLAWLIVFAVVPVGFMFVLSFWSAGMFGIDRTFTTRNFVTIVSDPIYALIFLKTLRIALVSTVLSLVLSYPLAMFLARLGGGRRTLFLLLMFLPFWSSYVVRSYMWLPVLGRGGIVNQVLLWLGVIDQPLDGLLFNEGAVYVGLIYVYTLFMVLPILLSLDRIDGSLIEAATDLGARPLETFRRVILPLSMPGVWSGCTMVFLLSIGAYVAPQLLGGTSGVMIGNIIASQFLSTNNWPLGAALSSVLIVLVILIFVVLGRRLGLRQLFMGER
jgi:spermidine/putrescine transport system permease protein